MSDDQLKADRVQQALDQAAEKKREKLASRGKGRGARSSENQVIVEKALALRKKTKDGDV